jgi:hypothetical protein
LNTCFTSKIAPLCNPYSADEQVTFQHITERAFFNELVFEGDIERELSVETTAKTEYVAKSDASDSRT